MERNPMSEKEKSRTHQRWAHLRFSIVGPLLAAPPERGELEAELEKLAGKQWLHPVTGQPARFSVSTIQRWYYAARAEKQDPVGVLRRKIRRDSGRQRSMSADLARLLETQYAAHRRWSYQLHADNLRVVVLDDPHYGAMPSYSSIVRYMKSHGWIRMPRSGGRKMTPGIERAQIRLESREVRSYEAAHVNALWHLDFHHGSHKILTAAGEWVKPLLLGILDDHSRLICHAQWYWSETAEDLVHGLGQAFLKRGLPRSLLTDNGSAMMAAETTQGLERLGIVHDTTLPYSPYQNGKQESFWGQVEGRLLAMLENCVDLSLAFLNEATQAWIEMEYHRQIHSETGQTPLKRFLESPNVGRECPSPETLRLAFCQETSRTQRRSDGTISLKGMRLEIPSRFRHLSTIHVRYAGWDLTTVHLIDPRTSTVLARLYPLDRARNAEGLRRSLEPIPNGAAEAAVSDKQEPVAPLLRKLLEDYSATGLPPAYLPQTKKEDS
jgi:transposase InsO family protein